MTKKYEEMLYDYNFRGQPTSLVTGGIPGITLATDIDGNFIVTYTIFDEANDLDGTYYDNREEEIDFATSAKIYTASREVAIFGIPTGEQHAFYIYDPDGDPTSGDERIM